MLKTLNENWDTFQWHIYIYCQLKRFIIKLLSVSFITSSLFSQPSLIRNIISLPFFVARLGHKKNSFLSLLARPVWKITSDVPAWPDLLEKSPLICWVGNGPRARHRPVQTSKPIFQQFANFQWNNAVFMGWKKAFIKY